MLIFGCFNRQALWFCRLVFEGKETRIMKKKPIRVALWFATFTKDQLNSFAILVLACLKTNPLFPDLPVKIADLQALVAAYQDKMTAAAQGGPIDTAAFYEAWDALVAALRQIAAYIQSLGLTNESDVLSSGFDIIIPGRHPQEPLNQPVMGLDNSVTGRLGVDIGAVANAKAYHVQYANGSGAMADLGIFPSTRNIVIPATTPGATYSARARAVGGSTQYSSWSAAVSLMST